MQIRKNKLSNDIILYKIKSILQKQTIWQPNLSATHNNYKSHMER